MLPSFLLALREGIEAALIIGIVLGALRKLNRTDMSRRVWLGAGIAALTSALAAAALMLLGAEFEGRAEELFEGFTMLLAAGVLTWMIFWMQRQARNLRRNIEDEVRVTISGRGGNGLFLLAFFAVVREGVELALFLSAAGLSADPLPVIAGGLTGLAAAAVLGWLMFASTTRLDIRRFFAVTNVLLIVFAAGLVAHGAHELVEAGLLPALVQPVYDVSFILSEESLVGQVFTSLFGYNSNPALIEVMLYAGYLLVILVAVSLSRRRMVATQPQA